MGGFKKAIGWWARNWAAFVEATRGSTNGLAGPNPWGETPRQRKGQDR